MKKIFTPVAAELVSKEQQIVGELNAVQGKPADIRGYYHPDETATSAAMRPSPTFNAILEMV